VKLLFDENLSPQLVEALADLHPGSQHVHDHGLGASDDREVWEYAKSHGFAVVTKDLDFYNRSMRAGAPPKSDLDTAGELHDLCGRDAAAQQ